MTDILYKALYMVVVVIGFSFIIVLVLIYIMMKTYVTLTIPILWILRRVVETLEGEEARRKGIYITYTPIMDMTILGMAPWGIDDEWNKDIDDDIDDDPHADY